VQKGEYPSQARSTIDLSHFEVNRVYDVGTSLANYLMASGFIPVDDIKANAQSTPRSNRR